MTGQPLDLDTLERAITGMTPGPWVQRKPTHYVSTDAHIGWEHVFKALSDRNRDNDAAGIVALVNAAPALIAEMRRLREEVATVTAERDKIISDLDNWCKKIARAFADEEPEVPHGD
jgi:hypothetical protein